MEKDIKLIPKLNKDWQTGKISIKKIKGHTTNRNWTVESFDKLRARKFFVRLPWEKTDIVDRQAEGGNILAVSKNKKLKGVVPKFFVYVLKKKNILNPKEKLNFPDGTMVMEYIEGKDIDGEDLKDPKTQTALAKALCAFHSSGVKFVNNYDVFRDEVEKYRKKAKKYSVEKLLDRNKIEQIERIEKEVKNGLPLGGKLSTHNDLIFTNLRMGKDGKIYILDFEYAGLNVRNGLYYDLGIILGGNLFYEKPITVKIFEEFLKKAKRIYGKDLDNYKIYCGALTNVLVMFWWGVIKYFSSKAASEKKYFKKYVLDRAEGIEKLYQYIKKGS